MLPLLCVLGSCAQVALLRVIDPPLTHTMAMRAIDGRAMPAHARVRLSSLPRHVAGAAVASEDGAFFFHDGFDWGAICRALEGPDGKDGRPKRGGSTITQQVARNVFLWQERSWLRKGLEAWYAVLLEALLPKERILEVYLQVAETGPMTFGIESGARLHFGVGAAQLSAEQAARLAAILPSPKKWRVGGEVATQRVAFIGKNMPIWPDHKGFEAARTRWRGAAPGPCWP